MPQIIRDQAPPTRCGPQYGRALRRGPGLAFGRNHRIGSPRRLDLFAAQRQAHRHRRVVSDDGRTLTYDPQQRGAVGVVWIAAILPVPAKAACGRGIWSEDTPVKRLDAALVLRPVPINLGHDEEVGRSTFDPAQDDLKHRRVAAREYVEPAKLPGTSMYCRCAISDWLRRAGRIARSAGVGGGGCKRGCEYQRRVPGVVGAGGGAGSPALWRGGQAAQTACAPDAAAGVRAGTAMSPRRSSRKTDALDRQGVLRSAVNRWLNGGIAAAA